MCNSGFIEEVQEPSSPDSGTGLTSDNASGPGFDVGGGFDFLQILRGIGAMHTPDGGGGGGGPTTVRFQGGPSSANFQRTRSEGSNNPPGFSFVLGSSG